MQQQARCTRAGLIRFKVQGSRFKCLRKNGGHACLSRVSMPRLNYTCLRGEFRREDTFLEQLTGGIQQSGPSEIWIGNDFWWLLDTHTWFYFGWKCPSCWDWVTRLSSLQKGEEYYWQTVRKKQSVWIVRLCPVTLWHQVGPCVSAQAHFVECCSPREKAFWCVLPTATILWTVNSVLNTSTMCHVCTLLSLRVLYMYCRAPCRALSMNLEPWHTCKRLSGFAGRSLASFMQYSLGKSSRWE